MKIRKIRKTGLTLAPEAGTERLRKVINKDISEEELLHSCQLAFSLGWRLVKLYFMMGLPTESEQDLVAIVNLAAKVKRSGKGDPRRQRRQTSRFPLSSLSPTPLSSGKHRLIWKPPGKDNNCSGLACKERKLRFKHHDARLSFFGGGFLPGRPASGTSPRKSGYGRLPFRRLDRAFQFRTLAGSLSGLPDRA